MQNNNDNHYHRMEIKELTILRFAKDYLLGIKAIDNLPPEKSSSNWLPRNA
jgi:hypothetical protein